MFVKNKTKFDFSKIPARKNPEYLKKIMRTLKNPENREEVMRHIPLELGDVRLIKTNPILDCYDWSDYEKVPEGIVEFVADPDYLHFLTKYILNLELLPYQLAILRMMWLKPFFMFIGSRGAAKSFLVAVYIVCRLIMHQGCRICVVGAALRQSLVVFNYVVNIWNNAPVLQDICGGETSKPKRDINMHYWEVGLSKVTFLPLGDGETIRGQRANIVISDEFSCLGHDSLVTTDKGIIRIGEYTERFETDEDVKLFTGEENVKERPEKFIRTPETDVFEITTRNGFNFKCSSIHTVMTQDGWKLAKDLIPGEDYLLHETKYEFPTEIIKENGFVLDDTLAYLMGLLISEGYVVEDHELSITNTDYRVIQKALDYALKYFGKDLSYGIYEKEPMHDERGFDCKRSYTLKFFGKSVVKVFRDFGLKPVTSHYKCVPWAVLRSPKDIVLSFLSGLWEGDGSAFTYDNNGIQHLGAAYYSVCKQLVNEVQFLMHILGCEGNIQSRDSNLSDLPQWMVRFNGPEAQKILDMLEVMRWDKVREQQYFIDRNKYNGVTKDGKRWAVRTTDYSGKVIKSKRFDSFEEADAYGDESVKDKKKYLKVKSVVKLPEKERLYDFYLEDTHCFYANGFKQHNSINREVFETVVRGFAAVKSEGVAFNVAQAARQELKDLLNQDEEKEEEEKIELGNILTGNQIIVSGTPSFEFNHFYKYFQYYRAIILSGGNKDELREQFPEFANDEDIDATEYCIVRLPYSELPPGLMDESILSQGRATMDKFIFMMEYCACFARDSAGFFPASVVQRSTCPMEYPDGKKMTFYPSLELPFEIQCVMGVDPASESDNFAINIVAVFGSWRGTVYQWVTNRRDFEKLLRDKLVSPDIVDYQTFCIKKIRSLTHRFNIKLIVLDDGGGGLAIREGLKDPSKFINAKDQPYLDMDDENTLAMDGLRTLKMISFRDATWRREAHWGLKKDIELRKILFPEFDIAKIALEEFKDQVMGQQETHDTIHDCWDELEQMKREMILIKHEITSITGQEKWDVPTAYGLSKELDKQKMKKDRFTSLLLANWGTRLLDVGEEMDKLHDKHHPHVGGVTAYSEISKDQPMYYGIGAKTMKNGEYYTGKPHGTIYDVNLPRN